VIIEVNTLLDMYLMWIKTF